MKKILTLTLICATINLLAQNNTSPFPVSGNVGIGTVNPIHAIHIVRPTNSVSSIGLEQSGINMWRLGMAANSPDLRFSANNDGLTNSVFTIQQGGNIGVGTLNPLTKLYVDGDIGVPSFKKIKVGYYLNIQEHIKLENEFDRALIAQGLAWDNENNRYDLTSNSPYNRNGIILGNGGIKFFSHQGNVSSSPFWSQAELNNKVHLFVSNTGQVGIGTLSPQYGSLEIFQSSADDGGDKSYLSLHRGGQVDWQFGLMNNSFVIANGGGATRANLWENKNFTINPNGNVGIGTTSPNQKLHVGGYGQFDNGIVGNSAGLTLYGSSNSSNGMFLSQTGNLGIGITNPINTLSVVKNQQYPTSISVSNSGPVSASTIMQFLLSEDGNNTHGYFRRYRDGSGLTELGFTDNLAFSSGVASTKTEKMRILSNGNVGIGASNPSAKLEIYNNTTAGTSELLNKWSFDPNYWWLGLEQQHFGGSHVQWNFKQKNYTNEVDLLSFKLGNVGIGTTNPAAKLEVNGNAVFTGGVSGQGAKIFRDGASGGGVYGSQVGNTSVYSTNNLKFLTGNNADVRMTILSTGQIGIGTTTIPTDHKLAVAGNVIAEKIKVKKSNTWPDFVFSPSYKLPSLTEVESFVKQNSHLPEIPSAAEIEKEGQDLGEMNRLLLKKVEELTLYLIEVEKKNKEQDILIQKLLNK